MKDLVKSVFCPVAVLGFSLSAVPAHAADPSKLKVVPVSEVFEVYKGICMAHPGDPEAQAKAATQAPYNFTMVDDDGQGMVTFQNDRTALRLQEKDGIRVCMSLGVLDAKSSFDDAINVVRPTLGEPESKTEKGNIVWSGKSGGKDLSHVYVLAHVGEGSTALTMGVFSLATQ